MKYKLLDLLTEYKETNKDSLYEPVAVGKYGIRKRNEIYKKELSDDYSKNKVIRNNTLIVGMGSNQIDIGVLSNDEIYSVSPAYHTYRINIQVVGSDYLDLLFKANNDNYFRKYSIATARQGKKIDLKSLLNEIVDIPSFEEQGIIVGKIFDINELIRIEEKSLSLLDELTKSRFNEMFGNIESKEKGFELVTFERFVNDMHIGPFGSDMKNDCFVPKEKAHVMVYEQKHAIQKTMNLPTRYIDEQKFRKMSHFIVGPGDILVSCRGTLGECYIIPENAPIGVIHPSLMLVKVNEKYNPKFVLCLLERILSDDEGKGSGVKMAIKASELKKIRVINPPLKLVNDYLTFVQQVNKLKFINKK